MAHGDLRRLYLGGGRVGGRGVWPLPLHPGARGCLLAWSSPLHINDFLIFFKKKPFPPPPAPLTFFPVTPESPHRGEGSARGWRARLGERGGRPWESRGEWLGVRGAETPRSGPRCCSGCGISRNLGGGAETRGGSTEQGCRGRVPIRQRDPETEGGRQERDRQKGCQVETETEAGQARDREGESGDAGGTERPSGTETQEPG